MNKCIERLYNGIIKENPTFVLMLGMCPTLAVTVSATNGLGMGLSTAAVLVVSNALISLLRNIIPDKVRIPAFIVVVASVVTVVQLLRSGHLYSPDCCKLYYSGARGILCVKEQCAPVCFRRPWHGPWLYHRPDLYRLCP